MAAPIGNQNAARAKVWRAAIERALDKRSRGDRAAALESLAEQLLTLCEKGDLGALQELGNRLDGKPATIIVGDDEQPPVRFARIVRVIRKP